MNKSERALILIIIVLASMLCPGVYAGAPTISLKTVSESTGGLAVDQDATIKVVMEWDEFIANASVAFKVYNSTDDLVATLGTIYKLEVTDVNGSILTDTSTQGKDGKYDHSYTDIEDLTKSIGTHTYTLKVVDSTTGIVYDSKEFVVNVAAEQITLATTWEDTNNDRIIDQGESATFTVYVDWVFVEETETHSIWTTIDNEAPQQRSTITITKGSGSDTATFSNGWNSNGAKKILVELKDSSGSIVKTLKIPIEVGAQTQANTASTTDQTQPTGAINYLVSNPLLIVVILCVIAVVAYFLLRK